MKIRGSARGLVWLTMGTACGWGWGAPVAGRAAERNIVFIVVDDMGTTLGCYGDRTARTPHLDALGADGTVFERAYATTASCSASRSVIMSGLHNHANGQYGHQHDVHKFASFHDVAALALPRVLATEGYRTVHIGKYHVAPEEVYRFQTYLKANARNPIEMVEQVAPLIRAPDTRPFFLYFATADPHRGGGRDETWPGARKPNLFGNPGGRGGYAGIEEVRFDPARVEVPAFLPDTPECRAELAQYYQACARVDQGVGRLVRELREAGLWDKTLVVFTSDNGMAFAGAKTTVYEPGLHMPFLVRNPYESRRGVRSQALISHVDITPSLLDFAGGLDGRTCAPRRWIAPARIRKGTAHVATENRAGRHKFRSYHGRSWIPILGESAPAGWDVVFASHTFHEIQMYYPMRVVRDRDFKLIWNIAHPLPYPFASDLQESSTWQAQVALGQEARYGHRTIGRYIHRPAFELYAVRDGVPDESRDLASEPAHAGTLERYQRKLRAFQESTEDPWVLKWDYE